MKKWFIIFCLLCAWFNHHLICQEAYSEKATDVKWSVFWNNSLTLQSDVLNRKKITIVGLGTSVRKVFNSGIGIESKLSFRKWDDFNMTIIPLLIGPSYTVSSNSKTAFLIRSGIGPELILGNDYASIFAGFEIGPEVQIKMNENSSLIFGFDLAQAMTFHPNSFEYLDIYVGWQF